MSCGKLCTLSICVQILHMEFVKSKFFTSLESTIFPWIEHMASISSHTSHMLLLLEGSLNYHQHTCEYQHIHNSIYSTCDYRNLVILHVKVCDGDCMTIRVLARHCMHNFFAVSFDVVVMQMAWNIDFNVLVSTSCHSSPIYNSFLILWITHEWIISQVEGSLY